MTGRLSRFLLTMLVFGYAFLYLPIATLVVYSFNESRLVTVWSGFSTKWYGALLENEALLAAAGTSLLVGVVSATAATILGTLAGLALARRRLPGRMLFTGLLATPLVLPEVILGLALLLLIVAVQGLTGWPAERGIGTIAIAHATLAMAYVAVVVRSRLVGLDPAIEEAAMDLGARPAAVFFRITLPMIAPGVVAGWLLAFTLSLDDLVLASFTSGPGATTLPMAIFSSVRMGVSPQINALATVIVLVVTVVVLVAGRLVFAGGQRR
ncbi:putrescine transport system permease protein [Stella humosa]|uniref:Putrescine transport system permease protein n=1 Tax=Stella humosa TaxID=94 RepID=A0A3N1L2U0_9PROT|nr:ABC transporter permease subunit [Stella humosa]ROP83725.1 putrescine transport system permease protein [Stella humosa]